LSQSCARARNKQCEAQSPNYEIITPKSLAEALSLLVNEPQKWKPFAGGTDLMVMLEAGKLSHRNYLNLLPLQELRQIDVQENMSRSERSLRILMCRGTLFSSTSFQCFARQRAKQEASQFKIAALSAATS
jgi:xanthine dehydrogenase iron-sulfur cluster and FAD-binding subunit A